jgi:flagellum-specific ATP synthase
MTSVAPQNQVDSARRFRQLLAKYNKARDLIQLGAYAPGADPELDLAVRLHADMTRLLQQDMHSPALLHASVSQLQAVVQGA